MEEYIIKKEFGGIKNGVKGEIKLECPILLNEDALAFIERY